MEDCFEIWSDAIRYMVVRSVKLSRKVPYQLRMYTFQEFYFVFYNMLYSVNK